jgi:hypothetical protein
LSSDLLLFPRKYSTTFFNSAMLAFQANSWNFLRIYLSLVYKSEGKLKHPHLAYHESQCRTSDIFT